MEAELNLSMGYTYLPRENLCSKSSGGFYLLLGGKETPISALLFSALSAGEIMLFPMLLLPTFFFLTRSFTPSSSGVSY